MPLREQPEFVVGTPRVYVVGGSRLWSDGLAEFLCDEGFPTWQTDASSSAEVLTEVAGRVCYMSFANGRNHHDYVDNIKASRHGSVLEHVSLSFIIAGVSRSFTHELVRHRAGWAFSQLSQRFVDERPCQMVCPEAILKCKDDPILDWIYDRWEAHIREAKEKYDALAENLTLALAVEKGLPNDAIARDATLRKLIRGAARSVLPNATETKIFATANARALRHFLEMRGSPAADSEIRRVALLLYRAALPWWPDILDDYTVRVDLDGNEYLATDYRKV